MCAQIADWNFFLFSLETIMVALWHFSWYFSFCYCMAICCSVVGTRVSSKKAKVKMCIQWGIYTVFHLF